MVNCFEYQNIKSNKLPQGWGNSLNELEKFLQDSWNQRSTFYDDGETYKGKQQFLDFNVRNGVKAQKYIGTIKFKGEQLNIFPKVFKVDDDDDDASELSTKDLMDSLMVWLEYCDKSVFPFFSTKTKLDSVNNLKQLLITIYVGYLKTTIEKQLYFQYEDVSETGSYIKGKIDFKDYINNKYPNGNMHKFKYTYSSFEIDNKLNRIIKHVCRILEKDPESGTNKATLSNITKRLSEVSDVNCLPYDCDDVHLDSMHQNYSNILSMSKMFLLNKESSTEFGFSDSFCFLFPADMLFEGFVAGFMKEQFSEVASIRTQANDTHLANIIIDGKDYGSYANLREDILVDKDGCAYVLDTKYKTIERFEKVKEDKNKLGVSTADLRQMAIYAMKRNAKKLCLLYPLYRQEELETTDIKLNIDVFENGSKLFPCDILKIPFVFSDDIEKDKITIKNILNDFLT